MGRKKEARIRLKGTLETSFPTSPIVQHGNTGSLYSPKIWRHRCLPAKENPSFECRK